MTVDKQLKPLSLQQEHYNLYRLSPAIILCDKDHFNYPMTLLSKEKRHNLRLRFDCKKAEWSPEVMDATEWTSRNVEIMIMNRQFIDAKS